MAKSSTLSPTSQTSDYEAAVRKMMNTPVRSTGARVIVAYLEKKILMRFLHTLKHLNATHRFLILARSVKKSVCVSAFNAATACK